MADITDYSGYTGLCSDDTSADVIRRTRIIETQILLSRVDSTSKARPLL